MKSLNDAIQEQLTEIDADISARLEPFAAWLSRYVVQHDGAEVEPERWEIIIADDGSLYPSFRVDRFTVESEQGWTEAVDEADGDPEAEIPDDADNEEKSEAGDEEVVEQNYVYGQSNIAPTWVIYAWKAYSGDRYAVESRASFLDACVCAKELGPNR